MIFFDAVAPSHIIISEYPQPNFQRITKHLYRSNVILYCFDDYGLGFHSQSCRLAIYVDVIEYLLFSLQGTSNQFS